MPSQRTDRENRDQRLASQQLQSAVARLASRPSLRSVVLADRNLPLVALMHAALDTRLTLERGNSLCPEVAHPQAVVARAQPAVGGIEVSVVLVFRVGGGCQVKRAKRAQAQQIVEGVLVVDAVFSLDLHSALPSIGWPIV